MRDDAPAERGAPPSAYDSLAAGPATRCASGEGTKIDADIVRRRLIVRGRVQGVFFRGATQRRARELALAGWVRNLPDGSVEAVIEGPPGLVAQLVAFCREGPPAARVDGVDERDEAPEGLRGFGVR